MNRAWSDDEYLSMGQSEVSRDGDWPRSLFVLGFSGLLSGEGTPYKKLALYSIKKDLGIKARWPG